MSRAPSTLENSTAGITLVKSDVEIVAEHTAELDIVAQALEDNILQTTNSFEAEVRTVAQEISSVTTLSPIAAALNLLAADLSNLNQVAAALGEVNNVSNNMATMLLLESRLTDLMNIVSSLDNIDLVANNDENIESVVEGMPEITTVVAHMVDVIKVANNLDSTLKYLGAYTSHPTQRTDGTPLQDGDYYLNTVSDSIIYYNLMADTWLEVNPTEILEARDVTLAARDEAVLAKDDAVSAKDAAELSASAASSSETNAATSASEALTSRNTVVAAETVVLNAATEVEANRELAETAATISVTAKDESVLARNESVTAKEAAELSATNAATSENAASLSETSAANSAIAAGESESSASASKASAATDATRAESAMTAAEGFETASGGNASAAEEAATNAQASAQNAQTASDISAANANYKGNWVDLTGVLNVPASLKHRGVVYMLENNLPDVTASVPSAVNPDYFVLGIVGGNTPDSDRLGGELPEYYLEPDNLDDTGSTNKWSSQAEKDKLGTIEEGATADQTGAEIKAAYEAESNTNAFTDAEKTKLENLTQWDDPTEVEVKTLYEANPDTNAFTDAHKSKLESNLVTSVAAGTNVEVDNTNPLAPKVNVTATASSLPNDSGVSGTTIADSLDVLGQTLTDHLAAEGNVHNLTKGDISLGEVDNTSDVDKPVSTATQVELDKKLESTDIIDYQPQINKNKVFALAGMVL